MDMFFLRYFNMTIFVNLCQRHQYNIIICVCGDWMISTLAIPEHMLPIFR